MITQKLVDLSAARRREIFASLVSCQDAGMTPTQARQKLSLYFAISIKTIKEVETLGITHGWPPL